MAEAMKSQADTGEPPVKLLAVEQKTGQSSGETQSKELQLAINRERDYIAWMNETGDHQRRLWLGRERKRRYLRNETEEQRQRRLMLDRERKRRARLNELTQIQQYKLAIDHTLRQEQGQNETDEACQQILVRGRAVEEQRRQRLKSGRERKRRLLQNETEERRQQRLSMERERKRQARLFESEQARQQRLSMERERKRQTRLFESEQARQQRLSLERERVRKARLFESEQARQQRLSLERERKRRTRQFESEQARQDRLAIDRARKQKQLQNETVEQRQKRLATDRKRKCRYYMSKSLEKHTIEDSEDSEVEDSELVNSGNKESDQESEPDKVMAERVKVVGGTKDVLVGWKELAQINLKARQQSSSSSETAATGTYKSISSLPPVGYQPSNAGPSKTSNKNGEKASSDVIVLSDEDSPTSPVNVQQMDQKPGVLINAHQSGDGGDDGSKVVVLRELLQQEEQKLTMLKQIRTLQDTPLTSENSPGVVTRSNQSKPNIVVVPGNQKSLSTSNVSATSGISSRLQHLVDTIAVDQALNSCSQHLNSGSRLIKPAPPSQPHTTAPPPLTSTPLTLASTQQSNPKQKSLNLLNQTLIQNLAAPSMRLSGITGNSAKEVITISDSPSPVSKNPPPLLPTPSTTSVAAPRRLGTLSVGSSSSIQVPTISSTIAKSQLQAVTLADTSGKSKDLVLQQVVENSKRYRDYLMKQLHVRRSFQKQMEKRITIAPYPKTFRQVWPVIPVHDATFVRNFGLEAIFLHFDPNKKMMQEKATASSKVKPVCNQCGCDFASAWQIRKSNSKQLLLCEACDFHNLKVLQRSKLANQLKELVESIKKEEEKFHSECEEARNQVVALEKQTVLASQGHRPPPLTSQLQPRGSGGSLGLGALNPTSLTNHVITATGQASGKQGSTSGSEVVVVRNEQPRAVVPSVLPKAGGLQQASAVEVPSRKRKEAPSSHSLPSKAYKPGSTLDLTLNKLTQQLIKRKLDEQREERRQLQEAESERGKKDTSPPSVAGTESRKSRRKGTPRHKRHLSSSSVTSE